MRQQRVPVTPETKQEDLPEYLTVAEVAAFLRVAQWTIRENIKRGEIPHRRIGPKILLIPKSYLHESNAQVARGVELVPYEVTR